LDRNWVGVINLYRVQLNLGGEDYRVKRRLNA
jgi:hypothetical protein